MLDSKIWQKVQKACSECNKAQRKLKQEKKQNPQSRKAHKADKAWHQTWVKKKNIVKHTLWSTHCGLVEEAASNVKKTWKLIK